jgi:hypothetical protein
MRGSAAEGRAQPQLLECRVAAACLQYVKASLFSIADAQQVGDGT